MWLPNQDKHRSLAKWCQICVRCDWPNTRACCSAESYCSRLTLILWSSDTATQLKPTFVNPQGAQAQNAEGSQAKYWASVSEDLPLSARRQPKDTQLVTRNLPYPHNLFNWLAQCVMQLLNICVSPDTSTTQFFYFGLCDFCVVEGELCHKPDPKACHTLWLDIDFVSP